MHRYLITIALGMVLWLCMRSFGTAYLHSEIDHILEQKHYTGVDIVSHTYLGCDLGSAYGVYFSGIESTPDGFGVVRTGYVCCGMRTCEILAE